MSYIDKNLQLGETIEYRAELHPFLFAKPIVLSLLGFLFYNMSTAILHYTGLILLLIGIFHLVKRIFVKMGTEYILTNRRVILKYGVMSRDALELMLNKCEGVQIKQSVTGRIFGFGSLYVATGGSGNVFHFVTNPVKFRNEINRQIEAYYLNTNISNQE